MFLAVYCSIKKQNNPAAKSGQQDYLSSI